MSEVMAKALGRSLPVSTKFSIEVANHIKGRTTKRYSEATRWWHLDAET